MNTFVRREILDNSISGEKIFGGDINWVDGLYTDHLAVPHTGSDGTGSIDGSAFTIGLTERIAYVEASAVGAGSFFVWSSDYSHIAAAIQPSATQYGSLRLNSASGLNVFLTANTASRSYHLPKLVIGSSTSAYGDTYKLEVPDHWAYLKYISGNSSYITNGYFPNLNFEDHLSTWADIKDYTQLVDYLATNALDGGVGPLLEDSLQEIVDNITAWQMSQIANIQDAITTAEWYAVSELDQLVAIGSNVTFGDVDGNNITAVNDVTAGGTVEGARILETSGGMVLVPSQHRDIRGLHLDWYHPLGVGTSIRIVVEEGECIDTSNSVRMSLTSKMTKRLNDVWSAGDGNGGRAGALSTGYYWVHLIYNSSGGAVDVGYDTSLTATNLLAASGYTHYRPLGRVEWSAGATLNFFEEIALYYYTDRPLRSGFTVIISDTYVSSTQVLYAGAERLGKFATIWIQAGSDTSVNTELKYDIVSTRPSSLGSLTEVSSAPCNFLSGLSGDKVAPGEIVLNTTDSFLCKVFTTGSGEIAYNNFGSAALKGLRENTAFTLYLYTDT